MSSTCRSVRRALPAFAAGDLDAEAAARVRVHLVACNGCRLDAAAGARAARALQEARALPEACDEAWFSELHHAILTAAKSGVGQTALHRSARRRTASAVAAAALFVAGLAVSGASSREGGLHVRPPIRIAGDAPDAAGGAGRASMLPLGQEQWLGPHPGLMGRLEFRTLEQFETEGFQLRPPSQDQSFRSVRRLAPTAGASGGPTAAEPRR